ncbi:MAG: protein arginine kinase [Clostridia bacterium]|nr:protein arginine kinase [Clostridia bacterium]
MDNKDIVISSRVRLARNIAGYPFPSRLDSERSLLLTQKVNEALNTSERYDIIRVSDMDELRGESLKEMHLISEDLLKGNKYAAAIMNAKKDVCIMVNEEDHIRIQGFSSGADFKGAYEKAVRADDAISAAMKYAFDSQLGYLTACPTNVGTGMRASAMMFLPGLAITRSLEQCVNALSRLDITIRGEFGEGSDSSGYLFQLSNQKTLGVTEEEIISSMTDAVNQIAAQEKICRDALLNDNPVVLRDRIYRAYGALSSSYILSAKEFMEKIAFLRLGIYYNILSGESEAINDLIIKCQPANLMLNAGKKLSPDERDVLRSKLVRNAIKASVTIKEEN